MRRIIHSLFVVLFSGLVLATQAPTIAPSDNLVVEGIPPIPAALAEQVRPYTESRSAQFADWHPRERELLISTRFANTPQIHHVKAPGGARRQLTFFSEPVRSATYEPRGGNAFVFARDEGGNEFTQLYRLQVNDGKVALLTDGGRSQNQQGPWSRTGERLAYSSTRRNGTDRDIYVMTPADPKTDRLVLQGTGAGWEPLDWSPDDSRLLVEQFMSVTQTTIWTVDTATGEKVALTTPGEKVAYFGAEYSRDGRNVYVATDKDSDFQRLASIDVATRRLTPITTDINWDVESFDLSPDGGTVAFATNEAGVSRLYLYDVASRRTRPVTAAPPGVFSALRWHENGRDLAFSVAGARSPMDVYSIEAASGQVTRWTESELGGFVPAQLSEPELIRWKSHDGVEITGFYYRAASRFTGRRPVIINIHGGPEGQSRPGFLGRNNYYLNELGVSIIHPNVRGSVGYGKRFVDLDNGMKREDSVKDIGTLLDWIAQRPELDADRVMVTGGSYGGYMTLAVATHYNDRLRCAVDVVGISNFNTFLKNTESYRRDIRRAEYGDERDPEMAAFFERIAPLNNAHKIKKPLFVIQGGNDPRVPLSEAEQIVARVKQNGTPVWYLMARDEGHGFAKKQNVDFQFYTTVAFVRRYLLDEPLGLTESR